MPTVINVVGARPQFVKAGPVSRALSRKGIDEILIHTGQHYDSLMSDRIMTDVGLRDPDMNLGVGSGSHGVQTARMLEGLEEAISSTRPDAVLTYGDTNSTVAAALAAAKLGVFTAHVEAGLRSFNREMPEELNRVATDHLSDLLLAPTETAMDHLRREGLEERAMLVGDVMVDALRSIDFDKVRPPDWANDDFYVATIHRPSNTDDATRLEQVLSAFDALDLPTHLLAHPRLGSRLDEMAYRPSGNLHLHDPLSYAEMLRVVKLSSGLLTDSGGLQKEAFILGVKCTTIRGETEWPETLQGDWNRLAGDRLDSLNDIVSRPVSAVEGQPFGDGHAADAIVAETLSRLS